MTRHRILVVMDPGVDAAGDSSVAVIEEALERGIHVDVCAGEDLCVTTRGAAGHAREVRGAGIAGMALEDPSLESLASYHAILYREDPPFGVEALEASLILEHARGRALLINDPRGLREANEKLFALRFAQFTPPTAVLRQPDAIRAFCRQHDDVCVLKPLHGGAGRGVFVVRDDDPNADVIIDAATENGRRRIVVQAWLPVTDHGDKRIFLLDGEPAGALLRTPPDGGIRANLGVGGSPDATSLTEHEREITHVVGRACRSLGLVFVGLDVIANRLTEINVTSPTGLRQLEQLTGQRLQAQLVDWIAERMPPGAAAA